MSRPALLVVDSITHLDGRAAGCVVICGSHGGRFAAQVASEYHTRAVIFSDAGVGKDEAGIAGLRWLDSCGIAAAAVAHTSARIGDGVDIARRGVISHANASAVSAGVTAGLPCWSAATCMMAHPLRPATGAETEAEEGRHLLETDGVDVWALDSASDVLPSDAGAIVVTGSHGGLLGGRPDTAVKAPVLAAVYNDAGIGIDEAGISRLPALNAQGISGATVAAMSARIGDGRSTYFDGRLSAVNSIAFSKGARVGMGTREFVALHRRGAAETRRCV